MITVGSVAFHSVRFFETVTVDNPRIGAGYLIAKTNYAKSSYFQVYTHVLVPLNDILLPWLVLFLLCIALPIRYIKVQREVTRLLLAPFWDV